MCLRVDAGGNGDGKGTHISTFLYLMAGENDNNLEWQMRATFTIELLNQDEDQNHHKATLSYTATTPDESNSKVSEGLAESGWGKPKFITYQDFENMQYLKDDTLYFRVTMTKQVSESKPWLAGAI